MVSALVFNDPALVGVLLSFYRSVLFPAFISSSYPSPKKEGRYYIANPNFKSST